MAVSHDAHRQLDARGAAPESPGGGSRFSRAGRAPEPNTISASQARAARRREALSNQQAVAAWLRELSRGR
jgi:hypothetical protein